MHKSLWVRLALSMLRLASYLVLFKIDIRIGVAVFVLVEIYPAYTE